MDKDKTSEAKEETSGSPSFLESMLNIEKNKYFIFIAAMIAVLAGVAEISGCNLQSFFTGDDDEKNTKSFTVNVHGKKGKNDLILRRKGQVEISYGTKKEVEDINDKGQAIFNEIPAWVFDQNSEILINVRNTEGEPYQSTFPDSLYQPIEGEALFLEVELMGLDKVFGSVFSEGAPLEGVVVLINELKDTSDVYGNYKISIPAKEHRQMQEVKFFKPGYQVELKNAYPQTQSPLNVIMTKK